MEGNLRFEIKGWGLSFDSSNGQHSLPPKVIRSNVARPLSFMSKRREILGLRSNAEIKFWSIQRPAFIATKSD